MNIRLASYNDLHRLWNKQFDEKYNDKIAEGILEIWIIEEKGKYIGRLDILWDSEDKDYANGKDRAYLSAFSILPEYRGRHIGTKLMMRVIDRICEKGYVRATIGAAAGDKRINEMYKRWGFVNKIKEDEFYYYENGIKITERFILYENENISRKQSGAL